MPRRLGLLLSMLVSVMLVGCTRPVQPAIPPTKPTIVQAANPPVVRTFVGVVFRDLPQGVEVTYSDGSKAMQPVDWDKSALDDNGVRRNMVVSGKVIGTDLQVKQQIVVLDGVISISQPGLTNEAWVDQVEARLKTFPVSYTFSPDRSAVVYAVGLDDMQLFLWKEGDSAAEPVAMQSDLYHEVEWSADSAYFFAIASTDVNVGVYVVDAQKNENCASLGSFLEAAWSPSSHEILIAPMTRDVRLIRDIGDGLAYDIAIYDVDTDSSSILVPGESDSLYSLGGWDGPDTVVYLHTDLVTDQERQLRVNVPR